MPSSANNRSAVSYIATMSVWVKGRYWPPICPGGAEFTTGGAAHLASLASRPDRRDFDGVLVNSMSIQRQNLTRIVTAKTCIKI